MAVVLVQECDGRTRLEAHDVPRCLSPQLPQQDVENDDLLKIDRCLHELLKKPFFASSSELHGTRTPLSRPSVKPGLLLLAR